MQFVKCLFPRFITNPYTHERQCVPCGKCDACLSRRQSSWVTRINIEARHWKHVVFFTLTYKDEFLPRIDTRAYLLDYDCDDTREAFQKSADFIAYHNLQIPVPSVRDCQLFIKRLRKRLCTYEKNKEKQVLRYFLSSEYGPTTLRPHYHGILFFSSDWLAGHIRECISAAWAHYSPCTRTFTSIGRIDAQFVSGDAANYVAGYTSYVSKLPCILQLPKFRPFSLHSSQPPIGYSEFTNAQTCQIFHNGLTKFSYKSPSSGEIVTLPLWRTFEDRLFPKIKGFAKLNTDERIALYGIASILPEEVNAYGYYRFLQFRSFWLESRGNKIDYLITLLQELYGDFEKSFDFSAFTRLLTISRHVLTQCNYFNCTLTYYVSRIELYYQNSDYQSLIAQLQAEVDYVEHVPHYPLSMLPLLIDPLFADNSRNLSMTVYLSYQAQFNINSKNDNYDLSTTEQYKQVFRRCHDFYENSRKTRQKNEYLQKHQELKYLSNLISQL